MRSATSDVSPARLALSRGQVLAVAGLACLSVPVFAASGSAVPLPGLAERAAASLVPFAGWLTPTDIVPSGAATAPQRPDHGVITLTSAERGLAQRGQTSSVGTTVAVSSPHARSARVHIRVKPRSHSRGALVAPATPTVSLPSASAQPAAPSSAATGSASKTTVGSGTGGASAKSAGTGSGSGSAAGQGGSSSGGGGSSSGGGGSSGQGGGTGSGTGSGSASGQGGSSSGGGGTSGQGGGTGSGTGSGNAVGQGGSSSGGGGTSSGGGGTSGSGSGAGKP
jgi:hypothetical protein